MRRAAGFTLIEMLVAITLMSLMGVVCWRGLAYVANQRTSIEHDSVELTQLLPAHPVQLGRGSLPRVHPAPGQSDLRTLESDDGISHTRLRPVAPARAATIAMGNVFMTYSFSHPIVLSLKKEPSCPAYLCSIERKYGTYT